MFCRNIYILFYILPSFMLDQTFDDIPQHTEAVPVCAAHHGPVDSSSQCWYHATYGASASKCSLFLPSICSVFSAPAGRKRAEEAQEELTVPPLPRSNPLTVSPLFNLKDSFSGRLFLIDTGAAASVFPHHSSAGVFLLGAPETFY